LALTLLIDALAVGLVAGLYATVAPMVPDEGTLNARRPMETTRIYAKDGTLLASLFEENRQVVDITEMPKALVQATIAIEDQRFMDHPGVDPRGIARAFRADSRGARQGASTITQQVAREVFLNREPTLRRKLQEMTLAVRMERRFSKEEILGRYLNQIHYGHRAYGVVAAADTYFGKKLDQLTLAECAMIAGLAKNPVGYNPIDKPDAARGRRDMVLSKMFEQGMITQAQYEQARAEPFVLRAKGDEPWKLRNYRAPWFTTYVIDQLVEKYGHDKVFGGGLQIYTTIDLDLQAYAQEVLNQSMREFASARANRGAIVCLDPRNGAILAMVGGTDFQKDEFNSAWQAYRQPGSSFKPYVYTTAMERIGLKPSDVYSASPATFVGFWGRYSPENFDDAQSGPVTVATALAQSINMVAVRVIIKVGPQNVIDQARRMGLDPEGTRLKPFPSLALGSGEVSPLEHANAYCAFANGGFRVDSFCVEQITDSMGSPVYRHDLKPVRVMSPRTYTWMNSMMQGVVSSGTGKNAQINSAVAGKTGTSQSAKDAWFMGITPGFVAAVWLGNERNERMYDASGGEFCAPIWRRVALKARELSRDRNSPWPDEFPRPGQEGPPSAMTVGTGTNAEEQAQEEGAEEGKPLKVKPPDKPKPPVTGAEGSAKPTLPIAPGTPLKPPAPTGPDPNTTPGRNGVEKPPTIAPTPVKPKPETPKPPTPKPPPRTAPAKPKPHDAPEPPSGKPKGE
jgi:penicillin-binding protein 1A